MFSSAEHSTLEQTKFLHLAKEFGHSLAAEDKYSYSAFNIVISNLAEEFCHLLAAIDQKQCSALPVSFSIVISKSKQESPISSISNCRQNVSKNLLLLFLWNVAKSMQKSITTIFFKYHKNVCMNLQLLLFQSVTEK